MSFSQATIMAMQAAYDKACSKVIEQGCKSYDEACLYRSKQGDQALSCAIGHLMTDEQMQKYSIREGTNAGTFCDELVKELLPNHDANANEMRVFLLELQRCHDDVNRSNFVENFITKARRLADTYGLVPIQK